MPNPFCHVELMTHDLPHAKKFYGELFDWKLQDMPEMGYTMIEVGEGTGGGMMKSPDPKILSSWMPYVLVSDAKASTQKARSLGAKVVKEVEEIPGYGWFSVIVDPTGATLGLWQPKER